MDVMFTECLVLNFWIRSLKSLGIVVKILWGPCNNNAPWGSVNVSITHNAELFFHILEPSMSFRITTPANQ